VRLRSDIWVAAYLRRVTARGDYAVLRRRGAAEAGAIFVVVDKLDGRVALFAPAPSELGERQWFRAHPDEWTHPAAIEARLEREQRFDPDIWVVAVETRGGHHGLELARSLPPSLSELARELHSSLQPRTEDVGDSSTPPLGSTGSTGGGA
jgi:hypothetical protein